MRRDRVAEDIYTFTSDLYAQVSAGIILTSEGTVVIDTLPFPEETREMLAFIEEHGHGEVRYVVNTHHHADHTNGNFLFPDADIVAHRRCREILLTLGVQSLEEAKHENPLLLEVELCAPTTVFENEAYIHLGSRSLYLTALPGHTTDSIGVLIEGDRILFAGDAVMPVPYIVWGSAEDTTRSLRAVRTLRPESVIQGHGDLLLKGELAEELETSIQYLQCITERVAELAEHGAPESALREIDIESCGKSRVPLDGLVQHLHRENLLSLYSKLSNRAADYKPAKKASRRIA